MREWLALAAVAGLLVIAACDTADTTAPVISIAVPVGGDTLAKGQITVKAVATDNKNVAKVEFYVDGAIFGTANVSSAGDTFQQTWTDTAGQTAGSHALTAEAFDDATTPNTTTSATVNIVIAGGGGGSGPTYHSGTISMDETWYPSGNPHIITGDVSVEDASNSPTLTIMPGCIVEFQGDYELYTGWSQAGAIVANGKPMDADSSILFTTTASPKTPGSWASVGVYYRATSATSFSYCTFEYGGSGAAMFIVENATAKFTNNTVSYSGTEGVKCSQEGHFSQFTGNAFNNNGGHALEIDPDYVGMLGGSNTFTANTNNDIFVRGGDVTSDATWLNQGAPYVLAGDISVEDVSNSPVLTIAPGCSLKFTNSDCELYTGWSQPGAIIAEGTVAAPIVFSTTATPKTPGSWNSVGVYYRATAATSFDYCTFEYGGSAEGHGSFFLENATAKLLHCVITQSSSDGVRTNGDGMFAAFTGNTISNCGAHAVETYPEYVKTLGSDNTYTGNTNNDILVHGGTVSTNARWLNQGVPYVLAADVKVEDASNSPVLTIAPGTTVKLQADAELNCGYSQPGGIIADGTLGQITFTSSVASPSPGDWASIGFYYRAMDSQCQLKNCRIEYGGSSDGNVIIENALPTVTGCNIGYSGTWGIYLNGTEYPDPATLLPPNNTFHDNTSGDVRVPPAK